MSESRFLDPKSYTHLCEACRSVLVTITHAFEEDLLGDTDDEEAPCNYMYDHRMFCGGFTCNQEGGEA